jgi:hypothetical protein
MAGRSSDVRRARSGLRGPPARIRDPLWEVVTEQPADRWTEQCRGRGHHPDRWPARATWKQCGLHRAAEYGYRVYGYRVEPIHATTTVPSEDRQPTPSLRHAGWR